MNEVMSPNQFAMYTRLEQAGMLPQRSRVDFCNPVIHIGTAVELARNYGIEFWPGISYGHIKAAYDDIWFDRSSLCEAVCECLLAIEERRPKVSGETDGDLLNMAVKAAEDFAEWAVSYPPASSEVEEEPDNVKRFAVEFNTADGMMTRYVFADHYTFHLEDRVVRFWKNGPEIATFFDVCSVREAND